MSIYITCEADLNFPFPDANRLLSQLNAMYDGRKPVTTLDIALAMGVETPLIADVLRRASHCGLVRQIEAHGWVPLSQ